MSINFKIRKIHMLVVLLCISPVIDTFTGFYKIMGLPTGDFLSIFYKALISGICICVCMCHSDSNSWIRYCIFVLFIILSVVWHLIIMSSIGLALSDINFYIRLVFPILIYYSLDKLIENRTIRYRELQDIANFYTIYIPFSIIIPKLLGVGFYTYESLESGYRGFYYAGNGINILAVIVMMISGERLIKNRSIKNFAIVMMNVITVILIGTKTSIIAIAFFFSLYLIFGYKQKKSMVLLFGIAFVAVILFIFYYYQNQDFFISIVNRLKFEYRRVDGNLIDFATNSRIKQSVPIVKESMTYKNMIFNIMFGVGYTKFLKVVEMDFIDIILHYGVFVLIYIICFYSKCFRNCKVQYIKFVFVFCMAYGCFAGHLLISPMGSMMLAVYLLIGKYKEEGYRWIKKE